MAWYDDTSGLANAVTISGIVQGIQAGGAKFASRVDNETIQNTGSVRADTITIGTADFCVEAYVRRKLVQYQALFDLRNDNNATNFVYYPRDDANHMQTYGATGFGAENVLWNDSNWHHLAAVRSSGVFSFLLDGSPTYASGFDSVDFVAAPFWFIGGKGNGYGGLDITCIRVTVGSSPYASDGTGFTAGVLPTAITDTKLLLNFETTVVPTIGTNPGVYVPPAPDPCGPGGGTHAQGGGLTMVVRNGAGVDADPVAGDLVVGELAINLVSGAIFVKRWDNSIFQLNSGAASVTNVADIADATATGKSLLLASDAAAIRTILDTYSTTQIDSKLIAARAAAFLS